jgi:hypothetical protein
MIENEFESIQQQASPTNKRAWLTPEVEKIDFIQTSAGGIVLNPDGLEFSSSGP